MKKLVALAMSMLLVGKGANTIVREHHVYCDVCGSTRPCEHVCMNYDEQSDYDVVRCNICGSTEHPGTICENYHEQRCDVCGSTQHYNAECRNYNECHGKHHNQHHKHH